MPYFLEKPVVYEKGEDFVAARRATDLSIMKYKSQG
jgi:hypothetical protein